MIGSTQDKIRNYLIQKGRGVFIFLQDFALYGNNDAVKKAFQRLSNEGTILRIAKGIYYYPKTDTQLGIGVLHPSIDEVAQAIAERDKTTIIPTGSYALNMLGLSTQVVTNAVYLTNGSPRRIKVGSGKGILFLHTSDNKMIVNPFIVSGKIAPEYFCDRVEEAAQLEKALCNQMNVVLTSSRRMGKTSLVDFVFDSPGIQEEYVTITVDILHTTTFREFILALGNAVFDCVATRSEKLRKQFVTFLKSLSASFGYDTLLNMPTFDIKLGDVQRPEYTLNEIFAYLEAVDKRCLVVIDEFQQITRYPEKNVEAILRTYIQKMSNANFVFSGSRRRLMEEMFFSSKRPFYQSAKSLRLEPIKTAVYQEFAIHHFQQAEKNITAEAFTFIYDTFWGVTFYILTEKPDVETAHCHEYRYNCCKLATYDWIEKMDISLDYLDFNIAEVRFKNSHKDFYVLPEEGVFHVGDIVAVEASPGHDIGIISMLGIAVKKQLAHKRIKPEDVTKKLYRTARVSDIDKWISTVDLEHTTMLSSRYIAWDLNLKMKVNDVEYQGDGTKAIFYYSAEERVDFRELIKILAEQFRIRIEMRQIGVRQEAARLGGIGTCGRELCCSAWLTNFQSVSTNTARTQQLSLNPQKLAGMCGKLKCCLNFEQSTYLEESKGFPAPNVHLKTKKGSARMRFLRRILRYSIPIHTMTPMANNNRV